MSAVDQFLAAGVAQVGKPYVYDTAGPNTFDCSGLVTFMAAQVGISLPHNAEEQRKATTPVTDPVPGDLVFYGDPAYHVGIYLGNGQMLSAPHSGATVHETSVGTPTSYGRIKGLGAALGPVTSAVAGVGSLLGGTLTDWLGGLRGIALQGGAVVFGVGLIGLGLWRGLAAPLRQRATSTVEELL